MAVAVGRSSDNRGRRVEMGAPRMTAMPVPVKAPSVMPTTMPPAVPTISLPLSAVGLTPALGLGGGGVKSRSRGEGDEHCTHQNAAYPSHGSILWPLAPAGIAAPGPPSMLSSTIAAIRREAPQSLSTFAKLMVPAGSSFCLARQPSRLPSFSDGGESIGEDWLLGEHGDEALDERGQLLFGHVRHEIVEHGALSEERVGAAFGGV